VIGVVAPEPCYRKSRAGLRTRSTGHPRADPAHPWLVLLGNCRDARARTLWLAQIALLRDEHAAADCNSSLHHAVQQVLSTAWRRDL